MEEIKNKLMEQGFSQDEAERAVNKLSEFCKEVAKVIRQILDAIIPAVAEAIKAVIKAIKLEYRKNKRSIKMKNQLYYESISKGKSNNWRKIHGLQLVRNCC